MSVNIALAFVALILALFAGFMERVTIPAVLIAIAVVLLAMIHLSPIFDGGLLR